MDLVAAFTRNVEKTFSMGTVRCDSHDGCLKHLQRPSKELSRPQDAGSGLGYSCYTYGRLFSKQLTHAYTARQKYNLKLPNALWYSTRLVTVACAIHAVPCRSNAAGHNSLR
jgi:hypothetical protein